MDVNNDTFDQVWLEISTGNSNELNFHQFIELKEKLNLDIDELSQRKSKATITVIAIILWYVFVVITIILSFASSSYFFFFNICFLTTIKTIFNTTPHLKGIY